MNCNENSILTNGHGKYTHIHTQIGSIVLFWFHLRYEHVRCKFRSPKLGAKRAIAEPNQCVCGPAMKRGMSGGAERWTAFNYCAVLIRSAFGSKALSDERNWHRYRSGNASPSPSQSSAVFSTVEVEVIGSEIERHYRITIVDVDRS